MVSIYHVQKSWLPFHAWQFHTILRHSGLQTAQLVDGAKTPLHKRAANLAQDLCVAGEQEIGQIFGPLVFILGLLVFPPAE